MSEKECTRPIRLPVVLGEHVPSKKNHHYPLKGGGLGIDKSVRERMSRLENGILCALYSASQTSGSGTPLECLKQLRTRLSGLLDDSIAEIPQGSWDVERVPAGQEGVEIIIEELT